MANTFKVIDMVTKEALRIAHEKLTFISTVDRQYDKSFEYEGLLIITEISDLQKTVKNLDGLKVSYSHFHQDFLQKSNVIVDINVIDENIANLANRR